MGTFINMTGQQIGKLLIIERYDSTKHGVKWKCLCDCGGEFIFSGLALRRGITKSCNSCTKGGNVLGEKFGRLTVIKKYGISKRGHATWLCKCDCGNEIVYTTSSLRSGTKSCGCILAEKNRKNRALPNGESSFNGLYAQYRIGAQKRGHSWELDKNQARKLFLGNCFYCGVEPKQRHMVGKNNGHFIYNGIDRKDNNVGYTIENCVSSCSLCNRGKRDMSVIEFINWINSVYDNQKRLQGVMG